MGDQAHEVSAALAVHLPIAHDSAERHVSGEALYVDDIPELRNLLYVWVALSTHASARILSMDTRAVESSPGVVAVLNSDSVVGKNDCSPTNGDDPVFAQDRVDFVGQVLFAVAAESESQARDACSNAQIEYELEDPILSIEDALEKESYVLPKSTVSFGDAQAALENATNRLQGTLKCGGQDHFYLEGQVAMAVPREGGDFLIYSSTQHPSEVQLLVAQVLRQAAEFHNCRGSSHGRWIWRQGNTGRPMGLHCRHCRSSHRSSCKTETRSRHRHAVYR